jgi:hypothetical protein
MSQLTNWYKLTPEAVLEVLHSKTQGLSLGEIESRLAQYGPNKLMEKKVDSYFIIFLKQFLNSVDLCVVDCGVGDDVPRGVYRFNRGSDCFGFKCCDWGFSGR